MCLSKYGDILGVRSHFSIPDSSDIISLVQSTGLLNSNFSMLLVVAAMRFSLLQQEAQGKNLLCGLCGGRTREHFLAAQKAKLPPLLQDRGVSAESAVGWVWSDMRPLATRNPANSNPQPATRVMLSNVQIRFYIPHSRDYPPGHQPALFRRIVSFCEEVKLDWRFRSPISFESR